MAGVRGIVLAVLLLAAAPAAASAAGEVTITSPTGGTFCSVPTFTGGANGTLNPVTLAIHIGAGAPEGPLAEPASSELPNGSSWSITPGALGSGTYTAVASQTGELLETQTSNPVTFTIGCGPSITVQPSGTTVSAGATASFTAGASGASSVQWEVSQNGGSSWSFAGSTSETLSVPNVTLADDGNEYRATFANGFGSATTNAAVLHVTAVAPTVTESPVSGSARNGESVTLKAVATGNPPPEASWGVKAPGAKGFAPIAATKTVVTGETTETTLVVTVTQANSRSEYGVQFKNSGGEAKSALATVTVEGSAPVVTQNPVSRSVALSEEATLTAAASGIPAPTVKWEESRNGGGSWSAVPGATSTTLSVPVQSRQHTASYRACFSNEFQADVCSQPAVLTFVGSAPAVTQNPEYKTIALGEPTTLKAAASGLPAPSVQWQESHNGSTSWSNVPGATSATLAIPAQSKERLNWYRACFSNEVKSEVCSQAALLTVTTPHAPTVVVNPLSTTVTAGGSATFTSAAIGPPPPEVQWEESVDGGATWTKINGATEDVLTIAGATAARSGAQFRAVFTNEEGSATSAVATLTVTTPLPPPPPPPPPAPASLAAGFSWFPPTPQVGETVTLASSSADATSAIVGLAWDFSGNGPLVPGPPLVTTTFATPGPHVVRLRAAAASGLVREVRQTINVVPRSLNLMQPFPVVRMAGSLTPSGVRVSLLTVQAPAGATVSARCVGKRCPYKVERGFAAARAGSGRVPPVTLWRFERFLRAGVVLQIKVYKPGQVGKYTSFTIRRRKLPVRVDECLDPSVFTPMVCPT
jgi:hypothetical protein